MGFKIGDTVIVTNEDIPSYLGCFGVVIEIKPSPYVGDVIYISVKYSSDSRRPRKWPLSDGDTFYHTSLSLMKRKEEKGGFARWINSSSK